MADTPEWNVSDTVFATDDSGERVQVACKLGLEKGPYYPKGPVRGRLCFQAPRDLTLHGYAIVGRAYVGDGIPPFDRQDGTPTLLFPSLRCPADQPVEVTFSFDLPDGCPSYNRKYGFQVEWQVCVLGEDGRPVLSLPIQVAASPEPTFDPRWKKPARATVWHWGMLFWAFIVAMGVWVLPVFRESLARETLDWFGIILSGLFCLATFLAPEVLYRGYTRILRGLWAPLKALHAFVTAKLVRLDRSQLKQGVMPGIRTSLDFPCLLRRPRATIQGISYWALTGEWEGRMPRTDSTKTKRFSIPIHFEGKKVQFSTPIPFEAVGEQNPDGTPASLHRLTIDLPTDVPFSYVRGYHGYSWELVLRGSWLGLPVVVHLPIRVAPAPHENRGSA